MAALTKTTAPGSYPAALTTPVPVTMTQMTGAGTNDTFAASGSDLVIVQNTSGGSTTVTITSVVDQFNRTGDIAQSVASGSIVVFGPLKPAGWQVAATGLISIKSSAAGAATITVGVIAVPAQ